MAVPKHHTNTIVSTCFVCKCFVWYITMFPNKNSFFGIIETIHMFGTVDGWHITLHQYVICRCNHEAVSLIQSPILCGNHLDDSEEELATIHSSEFRGHFGAIFLHYPNNSVASQIFIILGSILIRPATVKDVYNLSYPEYKTHPTKPYFGRDHIVWDCRIGLFKRDGTKHHIILIDAASDNFNTANKTILSITNE